VQLAWAPDALQKPAVLAAAAVAPAVIATAVSNPVKWHKQQQHSAISAYRLPLTIRISPKPLWHDA
jgi:hypothetical protein